MKQKIKIIFPILGVLALIFLPLVFSNKGILLFYGDSSEQMLQFYLGGWEKVHSGSLGLWDFSNAYGASSFCEVYYYLTSPFFWFCCLLPKEWIVFSFLTLNMLKLFLAYIFAYQWLKNILHKDYIAVIGALAATFCGWVCFLFHYNLFLDTYFLYFLLLYLADRYLFDRGNFLGITLAVAALCIINYYCAYMFLPFLMIYACVRLLSESEYDLKELCRFLGKIFGSILLGVGLSCFVLLPCAQIVLMSSRLSDNAVSLFHPVNWKVIYRIITSLFSPVIHRYDSNLFIAYETGNGLGWSGGLSLYTSIFVVLLCMAVPFMKNKKKRNVYLGTFALFGFMLIFPVFYKLLQGSLESRWYYMIALFNIYVAANILNEVDEKRIDGKKLCISALIMILMIGLFIVFSYYKWLMKDVRFLIKVMAGICLLLILYLFATLKNNKIILIILAMTEAILPMKMMFHEDGYIKAEDLQMEIHDLDFVIDYLKSIDPMFYRIGFSSRMDRFYENMPFMNNIASTTVYSSLYNFYQEDFLARFKKGWKINLNTGRIKTDNLMGVKYWISDQDDEVIPYGYLFVEKMVDYNIYLNKRCLYLGFATDKTLNEEVFKSLSFIDQDRLLPFYIITKDSENFQYEFFDSMFQIGGDWDPRHIEIELSNDRSGTILTIENQDLCDVNVTLYKEGTEVHSQHFVQYNYISFYYPPDIAFDKIVIEAPYATEKSDPFHIYAEQLVGYYEEHTDNLTTFYDVHQANDKIVGKIDLDQAMMVMTNIPYDPGWHVKVNGQEKEVKIVDLGFVGFECDEGSFTVELTYWPSSLTVGIVISVLSGLFLVYLICKRKKK